MKDISNLHEIDRIMINEEEIQTKVSEIAKRITEDYKNVKEEILLVGILKGSVVFLSDLCRKIDIPVSIDFISISSYGNSTQSTGDVRVLKDLDRNIEDKHIIIVEDIIDSGYTLEYLLASIKAKKAKSVKIATLLSKPSRRVVDVPVDYIGFEIEDEFIVGYGIDYAEKYRNLPFIGVIKREVYS